MPTRKIENIPQEIFCQDSDHNPPNMMVFQPGVYEHECPACHKKQVFTVYGGPF